MRRSEPFRACFITLLAVGILSTPALANAASPSKSPTSAKAKPAAATAKKKPKNSTQQQSNAATKSGGKKPYSAPPPLTAESLGLDSSLKDSVPTSETPPPPAAAAPGPAPEPVAPAPPPREQSPKIDPLAAASDKDKVIEPSSGPRRHLSITLNPAPIIAGRYGGNIELVPFRHHAFIASAYYQTFSPTMLRVLMPKAVDTSHGADAKVGGELGYRFYSGRDGAHGLFAGVSGVAMPIAYPRVKDDFKSEVVSMYAFGGAVDIGVQAITSAGFTIGGGIGGMYLAYEPPKSVTPPAGVDVPKIAEPHFLPRVLVAAGWSF